MDDLVDPNRVAFVGCVAVRNQNTLVLAQDLLQHLARARIRERKHDLVPVAVDRPEVAGLHLAPTLPTGLDRRLVHRYDVACQHRCPLSLVDRLQQISRAVHQPGQGRSGQADSGRCHPLVLAIQRQVIDELVDRHAGQQAHVGHALAQHRSRSRRAGQLAILLPLHHRTNVFQQDIGGRTLGQPVGHLLADDFVLVIQSRMGNPDLLHRQRVVETNLAFVHGIVAPLRAATTVLRDRDLRARRTLLLPLTEGKLTPVGIDQPALRFRSEQLALEPLELTTQLCDLPRLRFRRCGELLVRDKQLDDVFVIQRRCLLVQRHALFLSHSTSSAKHYSIQDQSKCALADLLFRLTGRKTESPTLKTLRKQGVPGAIPCDELQIVTATIEENVQTTGQRIFLQDVLNHGDQAVERFAHVHRLAVGQDPSRC